MASPKVTIQGIFETLSQDCEQKLSSFHNGSGDRILCRMVWSGDGFSRFMMDSNPLADMKGASRHKEIEGLSFERSCHAETEKLVLSLQDLPAGHRVHQLAIEVYLPDSRGRSRLHVEINGCTMRNKAAAPKALTSAILADLAA